MITENIAHPAFATLHLPGGKVFDGVICGNTPGSLFFMPGGYSCSRNFELPKYELEYIGFVDRAETGEVLSRYTMRLSNPSESPLANEFFDEFAS